MARWIRRATQRHHLAARLCCSLHAALGGARRVGRRRLPGRLPGERRVRDRTRRAGTASHRSGHLTTPSSRAGRCVRRLAVSRLRLAAVQRAPDRCLRSNERRQHSFGRLAIPRRGRPAPLCCRHCDHRVRPRRGSPVLMDTGVVCPHWETPRGLEVDQAARSDPTSIAGLLGNASAAARDSCKGRIR